MAWVLLYLACSGLFAMGWMWNANARSKEEKITDLTIRLQSTRVDLEAERFRRDAAERAKGRALQVLVEDPRGRSISALAVMFHERSKAAGFWPPVHQDPLRSPGDTWISQQLMLIGDELSEAHEALRDGKIRTYEKDGKPEGLEIELADAAIRLLDLCEGLGLDLEKAMLTKHAYNLTRPARHGRRF